MAPVRVEFSGEDRVKGNYRVRTMMMVRNERGVLREVGESHVVEKGRVEHIHVVEDIRPVGSGRDWDGIGRLFERVPRVVTQPRMRDLGSVPVVGEETGGTVYVDGQEVKLGLDERYESKQFPTLSFTGE